MFSAVVSLYRQSGSSEIDIESGSFSCQRPVDQVLEATIGRCKQLNP